MVNKYYNFINKCKQTFFYIVCITLCLSLHELKAFEIQKENIQYGGALYTTGINIKTNNDFSDPILGIEEKIKLRYNEAALDGGAIFIVRGKVHLSGQMLDISYNKSGECGGGIAFATYVPKSEENSGEIIDESENILNVIFSDDFEITINNNEAKNGGGIYMENTDVVFTGNINIHNNTTEENGAGLYINTPKNLQFTDKITITNNVAQQEGGGIYLWHPDDDITFEESSDTIITANNSFFDAGNGGGGGLAFKTNKSTDTDISFNGRLEINGNTSESSGGGILLDYFKNVYFGENSLSIIKNNDAINTNLHREIIITDDGEVEYGTTNDDDGGGAVIIRNSALVDIHGTIECSHNSVQGYGAGLAFLSIVDLKFHGHATLEDNIVKTIKGSTGGGAIYLRNISNTVIFEKTSNITIKNNHVIASEDVQGIQYYTGGAALYIYSRSDMYFRGTMTMDGNTALSPSARGGSILMSASWSSGASNYANLYFEHGSTTSILNSKTDGYGGGASFNRVYLLEINGVFELKDCYSGAAGSGGGGGMYATPVLFTLGQTGRLVCERNSTYSLNGGAAVLFDSTTKVNFKMNSFLTASNNNGEGSTSIIEFRGVNAIIIEELAIFNIQDNFIDPWSVNTPAVLKFNNTKIIELGGTFSISNNSYERDTHMHSLVPSRIRISRYNNSSGSSLSTYVIFKDTFKLTGEIIKESYDISISSDVRDSTEGLYNTLVSVYNPPLGDYVGLYSVYFGTFKYDGSMVSSNSFAKLTQYQGEPSITDTTTPNIDTSGTTEIWSEMATGAEWIEEKDGDVSKTIKWEDVLEDIEDSNGEGDDSESNDGAE